ncbi:MAG: threonine/serine dehydratase [Mycobacterium sp.]
MPTITRDDVLEAQARTQSVVRRTPLLAPAANDPRVWIKCEFLQHTGVFKPRGAFNRQLAARHRGELDPAVGVVTASGGNAGLANAFAARELGVPATVFVPHTAPAVKVARLREYGADVRLGGTEYVDAYDAAVQWASQSGALFCHAYDHTEVAAGAGVIAEEILQDAPEIDTIVVAVGGGGLFAGVAAAAEGRAGVVAVEPATIPTLHAALEAATPVDITVSGIAADSLGARRIGSIAFDVAQRTSPISVLVSDAQIIEARWRLWDQYRVPAEYGAATAYAALTSAAYQPGDGENVAVIICGANTDPTTLNVAAAT